MNIKEKPTALERKRKKKLQQVKQSRLIIRNLSFKATEDDIRKAFEPFGTIVDLNLPKKEDGKQHRGFAFITYENMGPSLRAIKHLNGKEILKRAIAVDFSLNKTAYTNQLQKEKSAKDESKPTVKDENNNKKVNKEKEAGTSKDESDESEEDSSDDSEEDEKDTKAKVDDDDDEEEDDDDDDDIEIDDEREEEDDDDDEDDDDPQNKKAKNRKPSKPSDVSEEKTVFIRNLDLDTTEADLAELLRSGFGPLEYCKVVINPYTEKSRGTAFAKFKRREDAQKCLEEDPESAKLYIDGQRLTVTLAVSRDKLEELETAKHNRHKDKRNLYLAKEGLIYPNSPAAAGVSQADLKKRLQLEEAKRRLLQNLHHFISDRRLCVHNLPPSVTDAKLRAIFQNAVKKDKSAKILWAKVMCNRSRAGDRKLGKSKGFGFVEFAEHRHALAALRQLNNNPTVFTAERRPIVEFSVENKMALNRKAYRAIKHQNVTAAAASAAKTSETGGKSTEEAAATEDGSSKLSKRKARKERKKNKKKGQKEETTNAAAEASKESEEPTFSGVMTKPLLKEDKVVLPKLNRRKIGEGKSELKKRHKALKAEQKKAVNSVRHQKKLKRRQAAAEQAKERREAPEREAPIIDAHFERRKRAFIQLTTTTASSSSKLQKDPLSGGGPRKKTKWFAQ